MAAAVAAAVAAAAVLRPMLLANSTVSARKVRLAAGGRPASLATPAKKKVLVPIGYGTEELEAVILVDVLRRAGADVLVASVEAALEVEASSGTRIVADAPISECRDQIFDLVALPGGMPGSARLRDCEILREITRRQAEAKRLYGGICAAPAVALHSWGLMKRKQMTSHPAFMDKLPTFWAVKSNLQVSGELTTSRGPGTSFEFALSFVEQLFGVSVAQEIGGVLLYKPGRQGPTKEEFNKVDWSLNSNPRVLVPIANGSEEIDVVALVDILRRAKVDVVVASVEKTLRVVASQKTKFVADKSINEASKSVYELIVLPGGFPGTERLLKSRILKKLLKAQELSGRMYGAMCSSPTLLEKEGLLKDKTTISSSSVVDELTGEVVTPSDIVIDGKIITSRGVGRAMDFALTIVHKLLGHSRARSVAEGLVLEYSKS